MTCVLLFSANISSKNMFPVESGFKVSPAMHIRGVIPKIAIFVLLNLDLVAGVAVGGYIVCFSKEYAGV